MSQKLLVQSLFKIARDRKDPCPEVIPDFKMSLDIKLQPNFYLITFYFEIQSNSDKLYHFGIFPIVPIALE